MAAESAYALPLAVTLRSAVDNLEGSAAFVAHIISDGLSPALKERVADSLAGTRLTVHWLSAPARAFAGLPLWGTMPATTYSRLLLPELLPDHERVLWLDCDVLVLADLTELWRERLDGAAAGAVRDPFIPCLGSRFGVADPGGLGLSPTAPYFNAGVLLVDLARWRELEIGRRTFDHLRRFRERVFYQDQAALNAVLAGDWTELPERWNRPPSPPGRRELLPAPGIMHFAGTFKPWRLPATSPLTRQYWEYVDRTAWRGWRPGRSLTGELLSRYGDSAFRRRVRPLEQRIFELYMIATRRYERERI